MSARSSKEPFYLLAIECNEGEFDVQSEIPDLFDTQAEAEMEAGAENAQYGVGVAVFECRPVWRIEQRLASDDSDQVVVEAPDPTLLVSIGDDPRLASFLAAHPRTDWPEYDGTDAAHPAWWRGCDEGAIQVVSAINKVLDGLERGKPRTGKFAGPLLEALARRLELLLLKAPS